MKVLYILHNKSIDGSLLSFMNMVEQLVQNDIKICIVCPQELKSIKMFVNRMNAINSVIYTATIYTSAIKRRSGIGGIYQWLKDLRWMFYYKIISRREIYAIVKNENPDIIHTNVSIIEEGSVVAKSLGIPHVWHMREYITKDYGLWIYPSFKRYCTMIKSSYVITITKDLQRHFGLIDNGMAQTIYNGVTSHNDVALLMPKQNYFLCASRVSPEKRIDMAIKAFSIFYKTHSEYRLMIAGEGDERYVSELKQLSTACGCSDSVIFLGFKTNIRELMSQAKALIVASSNEGFGRMTAEAAFYGCIIIGHNTAGTKEIIDNVGGLPYIGDESQLCERMCQVATMPASEYLQRARNAQHKAQHSYSNESNAENVYSLYKNIYNTNNRLKI